MTLAIDLVGKTILVCGVHKGGIGGATCRQIAQAGGTIIALDKEQSYVDDIATEVKARGATIHTLVADLLDPAQCEKVIPTVLERFGPIDGIANVAGGTRAEEWMPLDETPGDFFWKTNEWQEFGIRANSVSPGAVMSEHVLEKAAAMSAAAKAGRDPASKVIVSEAIELANAIAFLLSDLASEISGQNLTVDRSLSTRFCGASRRSRAELKQVR